MNMLIFDPNELAKLYKPLFVFSKDERYYPCSAEFIISQSQLYKGDELIKDFGELTPEILSENVGDNMKVHQDSYSGQLSSAPIYYFVRSSDRFIDIVFFLYFAYNGPFNILGKKVGAHDSDLEHVVVRLDSLTQQLIGIYFSAHSSEGKWVMKEDIKFVSTSPVIYVSKSSHAMYPNEGCQWRCMGFANDKTDFGLSWSSSTLTCVTDSDPIWTKYKGLWSRDGIDSITNKGWWKHQPTKNSNFLTRMIPTNWINNHCMKDAKFGEDNKEQQTYFKQEEPAEQIMKEN